MHRSQKPRGPEAVTGSSSDRPCGTAQPKLPTPPQLRGARLLPLAYPLPTEEAQSLPRHPGDRDGRRRAANLRRTLQRAHWFNSRVGQAQSQAARAPRTHAPMPCFCDKTQRVQRRAWYLHASPAPAGQSPNHVRAASGAFRFRPGASDHFRAPQSRLYL
ncbi:hypothetical protein BS50DRAFT_211353 [Corynespora cassiicola Philippines]|uniref:Uncharacterized protein n=1 Tax=Corynespora cassiicola Philippines TaxID=1448308 RepID=A0A2T2N457_CORCC|nr:hypothetical protein BS50DRAFT_211353 [Corynespora cassiicola Philippines]